MKTSFYPGRNIFLKVLKFLRTANFVSRNNINFFLIIFLIIHLARRNKFQEHHKTPFLPVLREHLILPKQGKSFLEFFDFPAVNTILEHLFLITPSLAAFVNILVKVITATIWIHFSSQEEATVPSVRILLHILHLTHMIYTGYLS